MDKPKNLPRKYVAIFCGANTGTSTIIVEETLKLCKLLVDHDYHLVYGGGKTGLMGIIADYFLMADREVIGVRPQRLITNEAAHTQISEMIIVEDMHSRKSKIVELSDLFIALPGGIGTLDEIIEVFTLRKIGYIDQPCAILNIDGYYSYLEEMLSRMVQFEYLNSSDKSKLVFCESAQDLIEKVIW
jgi:uncharacterized protein (TIGR00730 family)